VALDRGQYALAEDLLRRGASLSVKSREGKSPLVTLIEQIKMVQFDLDPVMQRGRTAREQKEQEQEVAAELKEALRTLDLLLARKPDVREALSLARRDELPQSVVARLQKAQRRP
jgi:hypothetical protein